MVVVSNTSPLTNLAAIGEIELLPRLFETISVAEAVRNELQAGGVQWPGSAEVQGAEWVDVHRMEEQPLIVVLRQDLDAGESETIALGLQLGADLVLMDEREGRHHARRLGLRTMGVVGIMLLAKERGLIARVDPQLQRLRTDAGFWLSDSVYQRALAAAGESG